MQVERKVKRKRERHVELKRCDSAIHNYSAGMIIFLRIYYTRRNIGGICGWHTHAKNIYSNKHTCKYKIRTRVFLVKRFYFRTAKFIISFPKLVRGCLYSNMIPCPLCVVAPKSTQILEDSLFSGQRL